MKFGKVQNADRIDFQLPNDHSGTQSVLAQSSEVLRNVYVGCAKWNKVDLKNFYPKGTKDELQYYSRQFNSIELNATFYRIFPPEQFVKWKEKTPEGFKFFPKVTQEISHWKRLEGAERAVDVYTHAVGFLEEKLGACFLQMHSNFAPKDFQRVVKFVTNWPKHIPLAMEFRHTDWYNDKKVAQELYALLEENNIGHVITDTAGRRDLLHMRLTTPWTFIRYTGANHKTDYTRLDDWVKRLKEWSANGLQGIHFFVHQNMELESPLLAAYFIQKLNNEMQISLSVPKTLSQPDLFL